MRAARSAASSTPERAAPEPLRLSAVVPATNRPPTLERCVGAIRAAQEPPDEVVVVDEAATPGPAAARNAGSERATGDVLVFVDADVLPHQDAFVRIRRAFESRTELVALFGSYDDRPASPDAVSSFRNLLHHHVHQAGAGRADTFWAGLGAIRRDAFLAAGGFDADRFRAPSIEDIDLGMRLVRGGALVELDPLLQGTHLKRWTLWEMVRTDFQHRGVPWVRLMLDERGNSTVLNLGWRHRLSAGASVAAVAALVTGRRRTAIAALAGLGLLNASFYGLLWRRRGPRGAATGIPLHVAHHLTGAAAVPAALAAHALARARRLTQ